MLPVAGSACAVFCAATVRYVGHIVLYCGSTVRLMSQETPDRLAALQNATGMNVDDGADRPASTLVCCMQFVVFHSTTALERPQLTGCTRVSPAAPTALVTPIRIRRTVYARSIDASRVEGRAGVRPG